MPRRPSRLPDSVPVLSRGKHRISRRGACFMEYASFLAGERFSDHPACTHPLLATMARGVNDHLTDDGRQRIVPLVSDVVGLVGDDPLVEVALAVEAATTAMPVAPYEQQKALAVGLLRCEDELAAMPDRDVARFVAQAHVGLEHCPDATRWAMGFVGRHWGQGQDFSRAASHIVRVAVSSISVSSASDDLLCGLLERSVAACKVWLGTPTPAAAPSSISEQAV